VLVYDIAIKIRSPSTTSADQNMDPTSPLFCFHSTKTIAITNPYNSTFVRTKKLHVMNALLRSIAASGIKMSLQCISRKSRREI